VENWSLLMFLRFLSWFQWVQPPFWCRCVLFDYFSVIFPTNQCLSLYKTLHIANRDKSFTTDFNLLFCTLSCSYISFLFPIMSLWLGIQWMCVVKLWDLSMCNIEWHLIIKCCSGPDLVVCSLWIAAWLSEKIQISLVFLNQSFVSILGPEI
jgi:hypothetical protein